MGSRYSLGPVPRTSLSHQILNALETSPEDLAVIDGISGVKVTRGQMADQVITLTLLKTYKIYC